MQNLRTYTVRFWPVIAICAVVSGVIGYGARTQSALTERVTLLEGQVAMLSSALQASGTLSEENHRQLAELTNRSNVIAKSQDELLTGAVAKASPAVVSIVVSRDVPLLEVEYVNPFGDDPYFRNVRYRVPVFRQVGTESKQVGAGTGFLVRSDGYIVTNKHVVDDMRADYVALLSTGDQREARVVYRDEELDIAILKIDGAGYETVTLGDSQALRLGQTVAAIGNALGEYSNSVSVGIISGLDRTVEVLDDRGRIEALNGVIQTDAAINRGNSGGPLLDLNGSAIGVNVAVDRGGENIAFAIPMDDIRPIIDRVLP